MTLPDVDWPPSWTVQPLWSLFRRVKDVGHPDEEMLSVYREHGIVPKGDRQDNFNKTAENRNIYQLIDEGWLVVNRMKAWQGSVGVSSHRGLVSGHYLCFAPEHGEHHRFLHYLLRSDVYAAELRRLSRGVRPGQIEIDNDWLRSLPVHLPDRATQAAIVDFLDTETVRLDELAAGTEALITRLTERKTSLLLAAADGSMTSEAPRLTSSLPWMRSRPKNWHEGLLRLLAVPGSGHTPSRDHPEWWVDCTIPWVTTGEVIQVRSDEREVITETRERISQLGLANSSATLHPAGTVVLCRTASAGYSAILGEAMATSQDFITWTCGPLLRPRFLLLCLRAMRGDLLGRLATGSTHKTIYMPDLYGLRVPVPPIEEQDAIMDAADTALRDMFASIHALERQAALLAERRRALITAAVTGELKVA